MPPVATDAGEPGSAADRGTSRTFTLIAHDDHDQPVPGAIVSVWSTALAAGMPPRPGDRADGDIRDLGASPDTRPVTEPPVEAAVTDGAGRCLLELPAREAAFVVTRDGRGEAGLSSGLWYAEAIWDAGDSPVDVVVRPQGLVDGIVLRAGEEPVRNVDVRFSNPSHILMPTEQAGRGVPRRPPDQRTDVDGRFSVLADHGYRGRACAVRDGVSSTVSGVYALPGGCHAVLRFPGRYSVRGRALDPHGNPVAGADVGIEGGAIPYGDATCGQDGHFEIALVEPGRYPVWARAPDRQLVMARPLAVVVITEAAPIMDIDVPFVEARAISGIVRWADGEPIRNATLRIEPEDTAEGELTWSQALAIRGSSWPEGVSGDDGTYTQSGLHPDYTYTVRCEGASAFGLTDTLAGVRAGATNADFVFTEAWREGATIDLTVLDGRTGSPLDGFEARVLKYVVEPSSRRGRPGPRVEPAVLSSRPRQATGRITLEHVLLGQEYVVQVCADGFAPQDAGPIDVSSGAARLTITMQPLGSLTVQVIDATGARAPGAVVRCFKPDTALIPADPRLRIAFEHAGSGGVADFGTVPPGRYALQAVGGPDLSDLVTVDVAPGADTGIVLTLDDTPTPGRLEVTVRDTRGAPVPGVGVQIMPEGREWIVAATASRLPQQAVTSMDGVARFDAVLPGISRVVCVYENHDMVTSVALIEGGSTTALEVRID